MIEAQKSIGEMMTLYEQGVRPLPAMLTDPKERLLAANLVVEEALEFADALGFNAVEQEDGSIKLVPSGREPDLVKAGDAVGDVLVVTLGGANRLGISAPDVFAEVHRSNMSKTWPHCGSCGAELDENDQHSPLRVVREACPALRPGGNGVYAVEQRLHKREEDGKVIKPPTYSKANIKRVLANQKPLPFATV
jgi:NTP pyrophosphatase (non-canonical NTP hydrolase)